MSDPNLIRFTLLLGVFLGSITTWTIQWILR